MRNLIIIVAIILFMVSCSKNNDTNISRIVIKGIISGSNVKGTGLKSAIQKWILKRYYPVISCEFGMM